MTTASLPLTVRWSHFEAAKSYARPFMAQFSEDGGHGVHGSVAVNGVELLYHRQFQAAVLQRTGELFSHPATEVAADPQRSWLDLLSEQLPAIEIVRLVPVSHFDEDDGRRYRFSPDAAACPWAAVDAGHLLDYQEFQAVIAHQTGSVYRCSDVEAVADDRRRHTVWSATVRAMLVTVPLDGR